MIPYFYIHKHLYPTLYNPIIVYKLASVAIEILFSVRFETHILLAYFHPHRLQERKNKV